MCKDLSCQCVSQVIVLLVVLAYYLDLPLPDRGFQVVEYFSGAGRIASMAKRAGFKAAAVDIEIGRRFRPGSRPPMDLNSNGGLLQLVLAQQF